MSFINGIKFVLEDYLLKKVNHLKKRALNDWYVSFGMSDEVVLFRNVLNKDVLDIDDINDLLLCYSDHLMDEYELLSFVTNNEYVYYEIEEASLSFDIRCLVINYLLQSNDLNVILGVFKLFSNELVECIKNDDIVSYCSLNIGNTLFDLYNCYLDILNEKDELLKKKKAISFISLINVDSFVDDIRLLNLSFFDIEEYILDYESYDNIDIQNVKRLLDNMLLIEGRVLGDNNIVKQVLLAYKEYSNNHLYFNLNDFIDYYNVNYKVDFSSFYYNKTSDKLDVNLLYSILNIKHGKNSFALYGEYLDRFKVFSDLNIEWCNKREVFINAHFKENDNRKIILNKYFLLIEELREPINITLNYYIYLNVPVELRDSFYNVLKWYSNYDKNYFNRDVFFDNEESKKNTFDAILLESKNSIYEDFKRRKFIHKEYLSLVKKMVDPKYISLKDWNEYLYAFAREYYVKEGLIHINVLLKRLENGLSLAEYQEENFDYSEFKHMCTSVKIAYPDMEESVELVFDRLNEELTRNILIERNYVDSLILARHSQILKEFIESDCISKIHFLNISGISALRFERAINVVRESNSELYDAYRNKVMNCLDRRSSLNGELSIKK